MVDGKARQSLLLAQSLLEACFFQVETCPTACLEAPLPT